MGIGYSASATPPQRASLMPRAVLCSEMGA
jgi:hypothetical protein